MEMQSRKFMSYSSPIQSEKENSSNSRVIKANTGLGVQCQNKQCLGVLVSWCWFSQWQWWWTQPLLMRRIGQRKYNYSQWEILIYSIWLTGVMKRWQNCVAQEEIWFESQTNPIQHFPKFEEVSCGAGIEIPIKMKYEKQSGEIQLMVSPKGPGTLNGVVKLWMSCVFLVLPGLQMNSKADHNPHAN